MTDHRRNLALGVVCLSTLVVNIDNLILNIALPTLTRDLHASTSQLQWIVDAYILAFAGLLMLGGSLGDRYGRAKVMRIGLVVFGTASAVAAWSGDSAALVACRAVMGIGAAMIVPTSVAALTNVFPEPRERARVLAIWTAVAGLGLALGPVLGGALLSQFWWGSVFLINVPIVAIALSVGWWAIPESRNPEASRFDPPGVVLSAVAVSGLVWATIQAPDHGWGSATTLVTFALALTALGGFILRELRCEHPMLQLGFFRDPRFSVACLATGTATFAYSGTLFVLTQLLQTVFGYTPLAAGFRLIPLGATFTLVSLTSHAFARRVGTKRAVSLGLTIVAISLLALAAIHATTSYGVVLVVAMGIGLGMGIAHSPTSDAVLGSVPKENAGLAAGTVSTTRQVNTALGVAVVGSLLVSGYQSTLAAGTRGLGLSRVDLATARTSLGAALGVAHRVGGTAGRALADTARDAFVHGMRVGMIACAGILAVGAILALRYLPARARAEQPVAVDLGELALAETLAD